LSLQKWTNRDESQVEMYKAAKRLNLVYEAAGWLTLDVVLWLGEVETSKRTDVKVTVYYRGCVGQCLLFEVQATLNSLRKNVPEGCGAREPSLRFTNAQEINKRKGKERT
jgi:hypothetical protein